MGRLRLGYVGCGFMAQKVHLPNFSSLEECEVAAIAEVREGLGKAVQERFGIPRRYGHHSELARDDTLDAFAVSAAFAAQGNIAKDLLRTGRPVFMEKPMAVSLAQADDILGAAATSGARLMVGYMKRYDAGNRLARDTIAGWRKSGEMGKATFARAHGFCGDWTAGLDTPMVRSEDPVPETPFRMPDWLPESAFRSYLGYLQQYTHNLNLLRFLLDAGDDVRVRAVDLDDDGYTGVVSLNVRGTRAVLESGRLRFHRWDEHTQVYFEKGWVHSWAPPLLQRNAPAEVEIYRGGETHAYERPIPPDRWTWAYKEEARHFVQRVRDGGPFESSGEDTRTDVRLFEEIYRAHLRREAH